MRRPTLILLGGACAVMAACTSSGTVASTFSSDVGGAGGTSATGGAGTGAASAASSVASTAQASSASSSASSAASSTAASSSSTSGTGGGPACDYSAPNDCAGAVELTSINGDTGDDIRTVTGTTAKWFKVLVVEGSNLATGLSYTATLASPPGIVWDLYMYPGDGSGPNCFADVILASGTPESFHDSWSDNFGSVDDRWVTFEVRYVSGAACGAAAKWTLTVEGNTP
jgi:hypothetical protein